MVSRRDFIKAGLGFAFGAALSLPSLEKARPPFDLGFTFATWDARLYEQTVLEKLVDLGIRDIAIHVSLYQQAPSSTSFTDRKLMRDESGRILKSYVGVPSDDKIANLICEARRRGLGIMMKPGLFVDDGINQFANIAPRDVHDWFHNYSTRIRHYARLADFAGANLFCVGNELTSLQRHERHWEALIADVRKDFKGKLTYAATHADFSGVNFYDRLDYIGINAYFPMRFNYAENKGTPLKQEELVNAWWWHAREVNQFVKAQGKPLLFTEFGCKSASDAAFSPGDCLLEGSPDQEEQFLVYDSMLRCLEQRIMPVEKVFLWASNQGACPTNISASDYSFLGKPTEHLIMTFNGRY